MTPTRSRSWPRPGPARHYELNEDTQAWHRDLGVAHVIVDPPRGDPQLRDFHEELARVAEVSGLTPRQA